MTHMGVLHHKKVITYNSIAINGAMPRKMIVIANPHRAAIFKNVTPAFGWKTDKAIWPEIVTGADYGAGLD